MRRCGCEPGGGASPESAITLILDVQLLDCECTSPLFASPQPWYFATVAEQPHQPCKGLTCTEGTTTAPTPQAHRSGAGAEAGLAPVSPHGACTVWRRRFSETLLGSRAESFRNLRTVLLPPGPPCHGTKYSGGTLESEHRETLACFWETRGQLLIEWSPKNFKS